MFNLKDFFENRIFDILGAFYNVKFVIRSGLSMIFHGSYDEVTRWMKETGYGRHEVVSAKLDFIMDVIEVQIR